MVPKNLVVGVLLLWACSATLLVLTFLRRHGGYQQCASYEKLQQRGSNIAPDQHQELSLGGVSPGVPILRPSPKTERANSNQLVNANEVSSELEINNATQNLNTDYSTVGDKVHRHLKKYVLEIFQPKADINNEEFTMIMLTYRRTKMLSQLIKHYCAVKKLHKILVIWNDVDSAIPQSITNLTQLCQTRLEFIREKENKLTNRFKPRSEIMTDCKLELVIKTSLACQMLTHGGGGGSGEHLYYIFFCRIAIIMCVNTYHGAHCVAYYCILHIAAHR